jgi:hypothetical protein
VYGDDRAGAELRGLCNLPCAIRHRHGRVLGDWRVLRDGERAAEISGCAFRLDAGGLSDGLPAGFGGNADADAGIRMEGGVFRGGCPSRR